MTGYQNLIVDSLEDFAVQLPLLGRVPERPIVPPAIDTAGPFGGPLGKRSLLDAEMPTDMVQ